MDAAALRPECRPTCADSHLACALSSIQAARGSAGLYVCRSWHVKCPRGARADPCRRATNDTEWTLRKAHLLRPRQPAPVPAERRTRNPPRRLINSAGSTTVPPFADPWLEEARRATVKGLSIVDLRARRRPQRPRTVTAVARSGLRIAPSREALDRSDGTCASTRMSIWACSNVFQSCGCRHAADERPNGRLT